MKKKHTNIILITLFFIFIIISYIIDYNDGQKVAISFFDICAEMFKILPCAFILTGLFEVWVKNESVIKHLGDNCGAKGYLWAFLLAGFSVGGLYIAFPIADTLYSKGASLKVIFTYLGFVGIFRIPMTIFEITFLGLPFTIARLLVTIPLFLLVGIFLGAILKKNNYKLNKITGLSKHKLDK